MRNDSVLNRDRSLWDEQLSQGAKIFAQLILLLGKQPHRRRANGLVDVIVPPAVYAECRAALREVFVVVEGVLQRNGPVLSILARQVCALPAD